MPASESKHPRGRSGVVVALLSVQVAFASWSIVGKVTLNVVPSTSLVVLRLAGSAIVFAVLALAQHRPLLPPRNEIRELLVLTLSGLVINQFLFTAGLARTSAIETSVVTATIPVLTLLYAVLTGRERPRPVIWLGVLVALLGTILVIRPERIALSDRHMVGDVMVLLNSASYAVYLVRGRDVMLRHGALNVITWMFVFAALITAPWGLPPIASLATHWTPRTSLAVAYVVLVPTAFAYGTNAWALARAPSSLVAVFVYLQPVLAIAMAVWAGNALASWLGVPAPNETMTRQTALGMLAVFAGVWISTRRR